MMRKTTLTALFIAFTMMFQVVSVFASSYPASVTPSEEKNVRQVTESAPSVPLPVTGVVEPSGAFLSTVTASGECGANLTWTLNS